VALNRAAPLISTRCSDAPDERYERGIKSHLKAALLAAFGVLMMLGAIYAAFF
jgi:hypothetical protein